MATFTNQATLTYNNITTNSNIATGELVEALTVTKTAVGSSYAQGEKVTYVISIVNSGSTAFNGLTVTDTLGAYTYGAQTLYPLSYEANSLLYYVNGELQATPTVAATQPLTVSGLSVPANGNAVIVYEASANEYAPLAAESTLVNTATLTGAGVANPITATESIGVASEARLIITKSISPATVTSGGRVTYTFLIQNYGNTAADEAAAAVVTDTFSPILSDLTVRLNGTALAETTGYTYNAATGAFATVAGQITLPAATYTQDAATGVVTTTPTTVILEVTGTI